MVKDVETISLQVVQDLQRLGTSLLKPRELQAIFFSNRTQWGLSKRFPFHKFETYMLRETDFVKTVLSFPNRPETRYCWGRPSVYKLAASLTPDGYFTHHSAMSLHELTDQLPRTVYINCEQRPKPTPNGDLAQDRIDAAFKRRPRVSRNIATYEDYRICMLNGMHTGGRGVIALQGPDNEELQVTCPERTLIDIAVRPFYSGGVFEVLDAYRRARNKVDVGVLVDMLAAMNYTYPFHQAIGFYMEKAGYAPDELAPLRSLPFDYDFYLTFQIRRPAYSETWRLFFPEGL